MDNPEPPPRQKRGRRASLTPSQHTDQIKEQQQQMQSQIQHYQLQQQQQHHHHHHQQQQQHHHHHHQIMGSSSECPPDFLQQVPARPRRLSRRASNPMVLAGGSMALPLEQHRAPIPAQLIPLNKCLKDNSSHSAMPQLTNGNKIEKHVKFVADTKKSDSSRPSRTNDKKCDHRRSLSVPASVRIRRPLHLMQIVGPPPPPPAIVATSAGAAAAAHTFMVPPPIESLLCSSAAPLSLPYWLQPPGCRSTATKSQNRIYHQAKLSSPAAKSQGTTRQLRPVIKTGYGSNNSNGGGSLSSGSGPDSGSDSEVSSQPRNSPPSAPKKVVTFNYLTQVQLVDI